MRIRIYVEGESERVGLPKLLALVNPSRVPVAVHPLKGSRFLPEIGFRVAEILCAESDAHVFACPDLAPNDAYRATRWAYTDYGSLQEVLRREVAGELRSRLAPRKAKLAADRFHPYPFRHDFEVLLLACPDLLKRRLRTDADITKHYRKKPEDQNFDEYPKKVVRRLFTKFLKSRYIPVADCAAILEYLTPGHVESIERACPRLKEFLAAIRQSLAAWHYNATSPEADAPSD